MKPFQIRKMWAISQACLVKRKGKENGFPFDYLIISLEIQRRTFRKQWFASYLCRSKESGRSVDVDSCVIKNCN